jgi:hypothetical protein
MEFGKNFRKGMFYFLTSAIISSCSVFDKVSIENVNDKEISYKDYSYDEEGVEKGMKKLSMIYDGRAYFDGEFFEVPGDYYVKENSLEEVLKIADSNPQGKKDKIITRDDYLYAYNQIK